MPFSMFVTEPGLELELEVEWEKASEKESEKDLRMLDGSCRICVGSCSCVVFIQYLYESRRETGHVVG